MSDHLTEEELDALEHNLRLCRDYEDYENTAFHVVHQNDGDTSFPITELPIMLVVALRAERKAHQATRAKRKWIRLGLNAWVTYVDDDHRIRFVQMNAPPDMYYLEHWNEHSGWNVLKGATDAARAGEASE